MKNILKKTILILTRMISIPFMVIPFAVRRGMIRALLLIESRIGGPDQSLRRLFLLLDDMNLVINERSMRYGDGEHPKHRLVPYHDFFIGNILEGENVLDVGCGEGIVARSIAAAFPDSHVMGIDIDESNIQRADDKNTHANLSFLHGDALINLPAEMYGNVVLSNVWEHIDKRVEFVQKLLVAVKPKRVLIRVPSFERDWHVPLRKELDMYYFSDPTHFIEHTLDQFRSEAMDSGLRINSLQTIWGEIWAVCEPMETHETEGL